MNWKQSITPTRVGIAAAAVAIVALVVFGLTSGTFHRACPDAVCGSSGSTATTTGKGGNGAQRPPLDKPPAPVAPPGSAAPEGTTRPTTDRLRPGQRLARGETLTSADGRYHLTLRESDGNLVIIEDRKTVIWSMGPRPDAGWLTNQLDGNIVLYRRDGTSIWASGTVGASNSTLYLLDDGNLALLDPAERMVWETDSDTNRSG